MKLYPGILTGDVTDAQVKLHQLQDFESIKVVHLDVIDGQFADNVTITPADFSKLDFGKLKADVHLMTEEPLDYVYELEAEQFHKVRAVIAQVEKMTSQSVFVEQVKKHDWQVGLALDLFTPLDEIDPVVWSQLDVLLLMSVEAGFSGQELHLHIFDKLKDFTDVKSMVKTELEIMIDGGVDQHNASQLATAGASSVELNSAFWKTIDRNSLITDIEAL